MAHNHAHSHAPSEDGSPGHARRLKLALALTGGYLIVEIAWLWLRFQPRSALSQWYRARFAGGGARMRRIGIVALARKLLIALWRYLEDGVMPEGARRIASEI